MGWIRKASLLGFWGVALYGVLQVGRLTTAWDHLLCGPWGCGPPLPALAAYHGFWFVLIGGITVAAIRIWPHQLLSYAGLVLSAAGATALLGIACWELVHWLPQATDWHRSYLLQRYLFVVATLADVPIVPLTLAGLCCFQTGRSRAGGER